MSQMKSTAHSLGVLSGGAAVAALVLFAIKYFLPDLYGQMGELETESIRVLVIVGGARLWSLFGPKGGMPEAGE